jgi:hypothetical protein
MRLKKAATLLVASTKQLQCNAARTSHVQSKKPAQTKASKDSRCSQLHALYWS